MGHGVLSRDSLCRWVENKEVIHRGQIPLLLDRPTADWPDRLIEWLLVLLLAFMPLALGAVHAWSEQVVISLAAALSLVFLLKLTVCRPVGSAWSWAYVPVAVFVGVAALQLWPLPASLVRIVSPHTLALKEDLLGSLPAAGRSLTSSPVTLYPDGTRHDLRLVLAVAAVFVVVVNVYRTPSQIQRLLAAVAAIGGGIGLLALAQDVAGNGRIYWLIPAYDGAFSATFINHSHYGQFMNLSMGAALALLLVRLHQAFHGRRITPARVAEYLRSPEASVPKFLVAMMVMGAVTVFVSLTRGGMVSMLIAAALTLAALSLRRSMQSHGWTIILLAMGAFVLLLYMGFDRVYDRLATLRDIHEGYDLRWQIVKDLAVVWARFPAVGTGLGTHQVVYPMFDRSMITGVAAHAENEYAQAAEETGLIGLSALVAFGIIVCIQYARAVAHPDVPIRSAAYGLGFGLLAILIHSASDFGQHLPANAMLSAVCCALLVAVARVRSHAQQGPGDSPDWSLRRAVRPAILVLAACAWVWAFAAANSARVAEGHWNAALLAEQRLEADGWQGDDQAFKDLISPAVAAAAACPDHIQYRYGLAVYRWRALARYVDPNTGAFPAEISTLIRQVVAELHQCRLVCPTFGAAYCVAGEIEAFVLRDPNGARNIRQGYRLSPSDPVACFAAARVDAMETRTEESFDKLCRAVQLDGQYFGSAAHLCLDSLGRPDLAIQLAGDETSRVAYVSDLLAAGDKPQDPSAPRAAGLPAADVDPRRKLAREAEAKAFDKLRVKCEQPDAPAVAHASLANLYSRSADAEAAIHHYRRALVKSYDQVGWHYALAQLLGQVNRVDEAVHEAQICLRLRPDYTPARKLLEALVIRPVATQPPLLQRR
jgi:hypothetical protein